MVLKRLCLCLVWCKTQLQKLVLCICFNSQIWVDLILVTIWTFYHEAKNLSCFGFFYWRWFWYSSFVLTLPCPAMIPEFARNRSLWCFFFFLMTYYWYYCVASLIALSYIFHFNSTNEFTVEWIYKYLSLVYNIAIRWNSIFGWSRRVQCQIILCCILIDVWAQNMNKYTLFWLSVFGWT